MKKKIITICCAILCAVLSIFCYRYVNSDEYRYKRDLKNAQSFYEKKEYDKALNVYLNILEKKNDPKAKEGLVEVYVASAKKHHSDNQEELAKNDLFQAMMFEGYNKDAFSLYEEWFPATSYEIPIKNMMHGLFAGDSRLLFGAVYPNIMKAYVNVYEENGLDEEYFYSGMDSVMEKDESGFYMIGEVKELTHNETIAYEQVVYEQYGVNIHVSNGYLVEVTLGMNGETEVDDIPVYEIAGEWYVSHEFLGIGLE